MLEYQVEPNQELILRVQLSADATSLYPQTKIYDSTNTLIDTVNLSHVNKGLYVGTWTNPGEQTKYYTQTIIYTDSGYSNESPVDRPDSDSINVGRYSAGGIFGGRSGGVARTELTKEEIEKIAKAVKEILDPTLEKKSEFNPTKDLVMISKDNFIEGWEELKKRFDGVVGELSGSAQDILRTIESQGYKNMNEMRELNGKTISGAVEAIKDSVGASIEPLQVQYNGIVEKVVEYLSVIEAIKSYVKTIDERFESVLGDYTEKILKETLEAKELDNLNYQMGFAKTMEKIVGTVSKSELRKAISEEDAETVYEYMKTLPLDERKKLFDSIVKKHPKLLKKLIAITYA